MQNERLAIAERIGRDDLQSGVLLELNDVYNARLEIDQRTSRSRSRSRSPGRAGARPRGAGSCARPAGKPRSSGRLGDAEAALDEARAIFSESGAALTLARTLNWLGASSGTSAISTAPRRTCGRRFACSSRSRIGGRWSRASDCWRRCCSTRGASRRRSGSPWSPARPSARGTCHRARRHGLRSGSSGPPRDGTTRQSCSCGSRRRSCGRPGSGAIRSQPLEALAEFLRARDRDDEAVEVEEALAALSATRGFRSRVEVPPSQAWWPAQPVAG